MNKIFLILLLLVVGCLGGESEQGVSNTPPKAAGEVTLQLTPKDVVLMQGSGVTHEFLLKFQGPAPSSIRLQPVEGKVGITVQPKDISVVNGQARGKITFAAPPNYLVGDQKAELRVTDSGGRLLAELTIDYYVLPPGAS
jgi:hypothetical protein